MKSLSRLIGRIEKIEQQAPRIAQEQERQIEAITDVFLELARERGMELSREEAKSQAAHTLARKRAIEAKYPDLSPQQRIRIELLEHASELAQKHNISQEKALELMIEARPELARWIGD